MDNVTKTIINNYYKSDNFLESGIRNDGLLKNNQKCGYNMAEVKHKDILYFLIHS